MSTSLRQLIPTAVRSDLKKLEERLLAVVDRAPDSLSVPAAVTLSAGGKRLRPALLLLCSYDWEKTGRLRGVLSRRKIDAGRERSGPGIKSDPFNAACAVELIHMGSLVHDDIVDDNPSRRGAETVAYRWDDHTAVCVGDFLFARAFGLLSEYKETRMARVVADIVCEMGSGELEQLDTINRTDAGIDRYMERIRKKTAVLFAVSCQLGGICAGVSKAEERALYSYGEQLGMAFQIYDDILDFTATEEELGKPPGTDLKEGNVTLPMVYALENDGGAVMSAIGAKDPDLIRTGLEAVISGEAIPRTKVMAVSFVDKAKEQAALIKSVRLRDNLTALADYVIERVN